MNGQRATAGLGDRYPVVAESPAWPVVIKDRALPEGALRQGGQPEMRRLARKLFLRLR